MLILLLKNRKLPRQAFSLVELLAVMAILGLISALVVPRFFSTSTTTKKNACYVYQGEIELQSQLWYRQKGSWPASDLSDIGSDTAYFPEGLPTCPVDESSYTFDSSTQQVVGHTH